MDGTPCYLWDYDGWKVIPGNEGLDEPKYTLAHTLGAVNPNARIIVILREPAERSVRSIRRHGQLQFIINSLVYYLVY